MKLLSLILMLVFLLAPYKAYSELVGSIGVHSKYVSRASEENDSASVQASLTYTGDGYYAGWWLSNIGYEYESGNPPTDNTSFEHNLYAGYVFDISDKLNFDLGVIQYVYSDVDDSNLTEVIGTINYDNFYVAGQYLVNDGWWGNEGDAYITAGYNLDVYKKLNLAFDVGYHFYDSDDNKDMCNPDPSGCNITTEDFNFRNFDVTLSYPVKDSANIYAQYIFGGEGRESEDLDDYFVLGITYDFGIGE